MTYTELFKNYGFEDHGNDEYLVYLKDDYEVGVLMHVEHVDHGWFWVVSHEGLDKPTKEQAERIFEIISGHIKEPEGFQEMSDYEFYKQTFGL